MLVSILLIVVLIVLNGIFAASEAAIVAINLNRLHEDVDNGNKKAIKVLRFVEDTTNFLSTIQIGITFIGFINAIIVSDAFSDSIVRYFASIMTVDAGIIRPIVTIVLTLILTYFQVVLGELVPKRIAIRYPRRISYAFINLNSFLSKIMKPLVMFLTGSANLIIKLLGIKIEDDANEFSEEEILLMVSAGRKVGSIDDRESEMIQNIFEFDDTSVDEIMTHRTEIIAIDIRSTKDEVVQIVSRERYTRFPVYQDSIDNIVGTIHSKDLLKHLDSENKTRFSLRKILRKPYFIPDSKIVSELFVEMKQTKNHIAIVIDEYGGTAGIVTMEDIIEQIVGNIFDEYDEEEVDIEKIKQDEYEIDGLASLEDVEDELNIDLPDEEYDTLSGFILGQLGRFPIKGEKVEVIFNNYKFKVLEIDDKVIDKVLVTKVEEAEEKLIAEAIEENVDISTNGAKE